MQNIVQIECHVSSVKLIFFGSASRVFIFFLAEAIMTHDQLLLQQFFEMSTDYQRADSRWFKWVRDELERLHILKKYRHDKWWHIEQHQWRCRENMRQSINTLHLRIQNGKH
jgi:hypothetical protein